jgi:hypothetical protein
MNSVKMKINVQIIFKTTLFLIWLIKRISYLKSFFRFNLFEFLEKRNKILL